MDKPTATYGRVSSDQQKENHTIQSQTAALIQYAKTHGYTVPPPWQFQDEGFSGANGLLQIAVSTLLRIRSNGHRCISACGALSIRH